MTCPSGALTQMTYRLAGVALLSVSALRRKIRSPQRTGEEWPTPGRLTFQLMSFSVQFAGMVVASLSPVPLGPRKRDHSWAEMMEEQAISKTATQQGRTRRMSSFLIRRGRRGGKGQVSILPDERAIRNLWTTRHSSYVGVRPNWPR